MLKTDFYSLTYEFSKKCKNPKIIKFLNRWFFFTKQPTWRKKIRFGHLIPFYLHERWLLINQKKPFWKIFSGKKVMKFWNFFGRFFHRWVHGSTSGALTRNTKTNTTFCRKIQKQHIYIWKKLPRFRRIRFSYLEVVYWSI